MIWLKVMLQIGVLRLEPISLWLQNLYSPHSSTGTQSHDFFLYKQIKEVVLKLWPQNHHHQQQQQHLETC